MTTPRLDKTTPSYPGTGLARPRDPTGNITIAQQDTLEDAPRVPPPPFAQGFKQHLHLAPARSKAAWRSYGEHYRDTLNDIGSSIANYGRWLPASIDTLTTREAKPTVFRRISAGICIPGWFAALPLFAATIGVYSLLALGFAPIVTGLRAIPQLFENEPLSEPRPDIMRQAKAAKAAKAAEAQN